ncbi:hypothetical protein AO070_09970 [Pseudomonas syringae pv. syringae PD2766]|nr:hypothetical protein AO070_09970 [Pseudomonas syringae pv. syringae PD2766]
MLPVPATAVAAPASSVIAAISPAASAMVVPTTVATVSAEAVVAPETAIATKAIIPPAIAWWASWLVVTGYWRRRVVTRGRGVITGLAVIARLRRYIDAPLLIVGRAVAIVIRVSATDDCRRLRVHIGFVITRASVATSKKKGQQRDKQGSSIHSGLLDRDWAQTSDAGRRPPKRLADEGSDSEMPF